MTTTAALPIDQISITSKVAVTCLGPGKEAHTRAMRGDCSGLTACDFPDVDIPCYIGRVPEIEEHPFPKALSAYDNRTTRLALAALASDDFGAGVTDALARWGAERVGVVLGTSTSGVERLEQDYRARAGDGPLSAGYSMRHNSDHHAVTGFLIDHLGLAGPSYTISTACSSSAKAVIDGVQMIQMGLCDAVLAGGVDSLCMTSLYGFDALELVSREPCRPCDAARDGLSIGEGAGFVLLERDRVGARLAGYGESSDAVSMSTPPEDGDGAARAMRLALKHAELQPGEISFIKLHGTATPTNDTAEAAAVKQVFGATVPAASLKGLVGHTLGAAGIVEPVMCLYAMDEGLMPGSVGLQDLDPAIQIAVQQHAEPHAMRHVLSNAFGFGGSNSTLILSAP
jgi:3-oxoacyl-[acyl-carrier-protein] synthase-1